MLGDVGKARYQINRFRLVGVTGAHGSSGPDGADVRVHRYGEMASLATASPPFW
jgi:hypothetical protein